MSYYRHYAIIVTGLDDEILKQAHDEAKRLFEQGENDLEYRWLGWISCIAYGCGNGYGSFLVPPDGASESSETSQYGDNTREAFITYLRKQVTSDGFPKLQWVAVQYGDDDLETKIVDDSDAPIRARYPVQPPQVEQTCVVSKTPPTAAELELQERLARIGWTVGWSHDASTDHWVASASSSITGAQSQASAPTKVEALQVLVMRLLYGEELITSAPSGATLTMLGSITAAIPQASTSQKVCTHDWRHLRSDTGLVRRVEMFYCCQCLLQQRVEG